MAASDALALPLKNTAFRVYFPVYKNDGTLITSWTGAAATRSLDAGTDGAATNTPTEIATSSGKGYLDLTAAEMNTNCTVVTITVTNTGALPTVLVLYPATDAMIRVNVAQFVNNAITQAAINAGAIAQDVLNAVASAYNIAGSIGAKINLAGAAGDPWSTTFPGSYLISQFGGVFASMFAKLSSNPINIVSPGNLALGVAGPFVPGADYRAIDGLQLAITSPFPALNATGGTITYYGSTASGGEIPVVGVLTDGQHGYIEFPATATIKMVQGTFKVLVTMPTTGDVIPWAFGTQLIQSVIPT